MNRFVPERPERPSLDDATRQPAASPAWQTVARTVLAVIVVGFGAWILFDFLPALAWAGVLAIALWPLYERLLRLLPGGRERVLGPALATLLIGAVIIGPLVLIGIALANEVHVAIRLINEARHYGIPPPYWLGEVPLVGAPVATWWKDHLSDPFLAQEMFGNINVGTLTYSARHYGGEVVHRLVILAFTLLTLFFLFRDGQGLTAQLRDLSDRLLGERGEDIARHMIAAVHGTVTGLVLVGIGEGVLLGIAYFLAGLPYPALVGAATAVAAIIPFGAVVAYCLAGIYLFSIGNALGAIIVIAFGSAVLFVADHFIRPVLIGGAARLPFLLVLLGLLGGLETMGILGLFLGPAVMAAVVALWREWTQPNRAAAAALPAPRRAVDARRSPR
ncbi:MAG TPA: AI-2E family transporter [Stellaceae bacterium]|nr:AI-2E family transporter [Stellaceae bacterium]